MVSHKRFLLLEVDRCGTNEVARFQETQHDAMVGVAVALGFTGRRER